MLRTNHVLAEPLKTMRPGVGWGMGVQVIMDAAAAGEPYSNGAFHWYGIGGTWFWIDPALDFAFIGMIQHDNLRTSTAVHGLSRNWVYQAIED
jgi:CubicO group peptidase (beta-lactamase class C family)